MPHGIRLTDKVAVVVIVKKHLAIVRPGNASDLSGCSATAGTAACVGVTGSMIVRIHLCQNTP